METEQINLKLTKDFLLAARRYAKHFGYRNIQELAAESMRQKIFSENEFDESFSEKEIDLIDSLISKSLKKGKIGDEEELNKILLG